MTETKSRFRDNFIWICFVALFIMIIGELATEWISEGSTPFIKVFLLYFKFIGPMVATFLLMYLFKKNRYLLKYVGAKCRGNNLKMLSLGILVGFVFNGISILAAYLNGDIKLTFSIFQPLQLLAIFVAVFIQSSTEEILCRGFIYRRLLNGYKSPWVAIIVNPIFFAALHLANPGVSVLAIYNLFIYGLLMSLIVYYTDSLWMVMGIHTMWNFTQNIIFGLPNSGLKAEYSIFKLTESTKSITFAYDPAFGVEGTILTVIVLTICTALIFYYGRKDAKNEFEI
ncbi:MULTISPECIES: CPBP family intramembrane glutamic endopeptidase [Helcococcus]|uniref:Type II CAAX endopeptidase family protein n=1 Tax=Helcococcus bovis TaxID=3153252 RepID=A0ABW9F7X2_9FIRM